MAWFRRRKPDEAEGSQATQTAQAVPLEKMGFLCGKGGILERQLEDKLSAIFGGYDIERAYLAMIDLGEEAAPTECLCLRSRAGEDPRLMEQIASAFNSVFDQGRELDVVFLSEDQEEEVLRACRPFYFGK